MSLIERPTTSLPGKLGWEPVNCCDETFGSTGILKREKDNLRRRRDLLLPRLVSGEIELKLERIGKELR